MKKIELNENEIVLLQDCITKQLVAILNKKNHFDDPDTEEYNILMKLNVSIAKQLDSQYREE
ncbi:MAG: hypothetical protein CVV02_01720 [Firmicutes bacterium HGW-Firmicutes-7]|nr:MAG: hypothetical protein CVV02_01720 [Firmicutes bacterium HGW-Firmicutes-7]